jgi:hypothetical protein
MSARGLVTAIAVVLAWAGVAQSRDAFVTIEGYSDIFITSSPDMLSHEINLGEHPSFTLGGATYDIVNVFGAWALSNGGDLAASGVDQNGWTYDENSIDVAGWKNPSKSHAIMPGELLTFTFDAIDAGAVDLAGLHVTTSETLPTGGNTLHIELAPEPASAAWFLVAAATGAVLRPRRR